MDEGRASSVKERLTVVAFLRYGNNVDALEPERIAGYAELNR
jgi:hypothetical protein